MDIPFIDLQKQYREHQEAIDTQIREVLDSSRYIMGDKVEKIENDLADFSGVNYGVGVASGTDALQLALMAHDVGPGDEVVTTPFTFIATAEVISLLRATPVFVDIEEDTWNIDPTAVEGAITDDTAAVIAVDLFGQCADYTRLESICEEHDVPLIEDAAQSFGATQNGARACSFGDVACTSFYPAKPLGCYGDGGMVFTDDEQLAECIRSLRVHGGGSNKYDNVRVGVNARLDAIQAGVLLGKFPAFPDEIAARQKVAERYTSELEGAVDRLPEIRPGNTSVWAQYCIEVPDRESLRDRLDEADIPTCVFYPCPLHLQDAFSHLGYEEGDLPVSEAASKRIMSLPMHPYMDEETQQYIIRTFLAS